MPVLYLIVQGIINEYQIYFPIGNTKNNPWFFLIIALWILFLKCLMYLCESFYISLRLTFSFYLLVDGDLTDLEG